MSAEPIVDGIEKEYQGVLTVLKVNVQEEVGEEIGVKYGFELTPSFLFFDANGEIILRTIGLITPEQVHTALRQP